MRGYYGDAPRGGRVPNTPGQTQQQQQQVFESILNGSQIQPNQQVVFPTFSTPFQAQAPQQALYQRPAQHRIQFSQQIPGMPTQAVNPAQVGWNPMQRVEYVSVPAVSQNHLVPVSRHRTVPPQGMLTPEMQAQMHLQSQMGASPRIPGVEQVMMLPVYSTNANGKFNGSVKVEVGEKRKIDALEQGTNTKATKIEHSGDAASTAKTKTCTYDGCNQPATDKGTCCTHSGQWLCLEPGCKRTVRRAKTKCSFHSALKRCSVENCESKAVSGRGIFRRCIIHGGGRRCQHENCTTSALKGGFCSKHGGGRRCNVQDCKATARKGFAVCYRHGGRNKCKNQDCEKLDAGRGYCIRHGGGRRCKVENCAKSALRFGLCAKHGGGKRCKIEGCGKSAPRAGLCPQHGNYGRLCKMKGCGRYTKDKSQHCDRHKGESS
eukprot:CAMPEP_0184016718 /NCGR_PEP_ID=MMETSP0954-20121128/7087_1 /TAXON_ID=627963 /ORGANISM="Aplanochytrium sp, Strain PBS07" /LENGTH=432 /DNA_ID=CAMNT_0026297775 /DNA_START=790 /DNA_END=2088 /DNA_ORIENTATION=+